MKISCRGLEGGRRSDKNSLIGKRGWRGEEGELSGCNISGFRVCDNQRNKHHELRGLGRSIGTLVRLRTAHIKAKVRERLPLLDQAEGDLFSNHSIDLITTIFPRIYARRHNAHPRARVMSFSQSINL
jgi:hypothetical protein